MRDAVMTQGEWDLREIGLSAFGGGVDWPVAVSVPARNEEQRIKACLDAIAASLRGRGGIVVNVNGSTDGTHRLALDWFAATGLRGLVISDPAPPAGSGVGHARELALRASLPCLIRGGVMMTTDADGLVDAGWVDANLAELAHGDLVCGAVSPDPDEYAALPPEVETRGRLEGEYIALLMRLNRLMTPDAVTLDEPHRNAAGASLAFRVPLYLDLGGMPGVAEREDRIFVEKATERGWRVIYSATPRVTASCRLDGRTPGGMAAALRARIFDADPFCDEILEPPEILLARLRAGTTPDPLPIAPRTRMRLSEVAEALPRLQSLVAELDRKETHS